MRPLLLSTLLLALGCPAPEPEPSGPPRCDNCDNAPECPDAQPSLNPLDPCPEMDAICFYCGPVMRRYVCQPTNAGDLRWQDAGEADMCPPPSEPATGTG